MNTVNATLEQVLQFRDERSAVQRELLASFNCPVISFTLNIAGPLKRSELTDFCFDQTLKKLPLRFGAPLCYKELRGAAGCAAFFSYALPADELKSGCIDLEESSPVGRLLDLDVLGTDGVKLSRQALRRCLICGGPAAPCARSRAHSLDELAFKTRSILRAYALEALSELAVQALLDEVRLTPKPGLVDAENSGANSDMDLALMEKSARSLGPYFRKTAELGFDCPAGLSQLLQRAGVEAEKTMFAATNGVNTHKGAVFSMGLLCAGAAMFLSGHGGDILKNAAVAAAGLSTAEAATHGAEMNKKYSAGGARSEALSAFPNVGTALEALRSGKTQLTALLTLLRDVEDSNLLWRGGEEGLALVKGEAARILEAPEADREELVRALDAVCTRRNLNPGGSADLFAGALFLRSLDPPSI